MKSTIVAGALLPHEIIRSLNEDGGDVAELQWKRVVDDCVAVGCWCVSYVRNLGRGRL